MYKPGGVYIDDPKGLFILRWYKEVDKDGKVLEGFQNPECAAYQLRLDNAKEIFTGIFRRTANVQIISKQGLLETQARSQGPAANVHTLNKKDEWMVKGGLKKKK